MDNEQLELGLKQPFLRVRVRRKRPARAAWWFEQMRRAVDSAVEWPSLASDRSDQIRLMPGRKPSAA